MEAGEREQFAADVAQGILGGVRELFAHEKRLRAVELRLVELGVKTDPSLSLLGEDEQHLPESLPLTEAPSAAQAEARPG